MKYIKVDSCKNCPYLSALFSNTCRHPKAENMSIFDVHKINNFCPLEDLPEK